jgi:hypothetical protein
LNVTTQETSPNLAWEFRGKNLNNSLLHVLAALANNHFEMIADLLDHPSLVGGYTGLMPHYLFAVLFEKVTVLHALTRMEVDADTGLAHTPMMS